MSLFFFGFPFPIITKFSSLELIIISALFIISVFEITPLQRPFNVAVIRESFCDFTN